MTHGFAKKHQRNNVSLLTAVSFVIPALTGSLAILAWRRSLLIEIDHPDDDQPSLVYFVESTTLSLEHFNCWIWSGI